MMLSAILGVLATLLGIICCLVYFYSVRNNISAKINEVTLNNSEVGIVYLSSDYVVKWENLSRYTNHPLAKNYKAGECCYKCVKNLNRPCQGCVVQKVLASRTREVKEVVFSEDIIGQIIANPVFDKKHNCIGVVMVFTDITDAKRRELILQQARDIAEKADSLKSEFLSNMSHEIRNPLSSIIGFSELLSTAETLEEKDEYLKIINDNNNLLLQLINDILDLSKIEADTLEFVYANVNVNTMLSELEKSFSFKSRYANNPVEIVFEKKLEDGILFTDKNRLSQVLSNFISNALKFTEHGKISLGCELQGDKVYFYVTDTGIGIPNDKLTDIFGRFVRLNNIKSGTGLGLAICKTIITKLKGEIGATSEFGKGSTFWFTIPYEKSTP
ncbi:MAG: HAMP domain-containing sensor histidine kinase [Bacteroidales bacterium]